MFSSIPTRDIRHKPWKEETNKNEYVGFRGNTKGNNPERGNNKDTYKKEDKHQLGRL